MIHIYCGDGKGKTTAAVGLAVRCAGSGGRVLFTSFLKDSRSSELEVLRKVAGIHMIENPPQVSFFRNMAEEEKERIKSISRNKMAEIILRQDRYDMVVLDEIFAAVHYGMVSEEELTGMIGNRPSGVEYVLTGRNPSQKLIEMADYVSEIRKIKHPFDRGIGARKGIEL